MIKKRNILWVLCIFVVSLFSCTNKKNTFTTRTYHNLTSRFNGLYYEREVFNEGVAKLESGHVDDYDKVLPLFVYGNLKEAETISAEMEATFKKGTKVLEKHSILMKNVEYCRWIDETYLLMGQSKFYKHEYFSAIEIFEYVASQFKKQPTKYEAWLWQFRTYNELGLFTKSQGFMDVLTDDKKMPKKYYADFYAIAADFYIKKEEYEPAIEWLKKAIEVTKKRSVKTRYLYVLAQLNQDLHQRNKSNELFSRVIKRHPAYVMEFNAQLNLAKNTDVKSSEIASIKKDLIKMEKDPKNLEYRDQLNYALAEIALKEKNINLAIKYLEKSVQTSTTNVKQKGISSLKLADVYFDIPDYEMASTYYDSAAILVPKTYPNYALILKKKNSLDDLITNINIITTEDSLQKLAKMDDKSREKLIEKTIANIIKSEKKKKEQEDALAYNNLQSASNTTSNIGTTDNKAWYFYNTSTLAYGFTEFTKKWGVRKLEDNWRRSNKQSMNNDADAPPVATNEDIKSATKTQKDSSKTPVLDSKNKDYYLQSIPNSEEKIKESNKKIIDAYYAQAIIYKEELKDYKKGVEVVNELLKRFPENDHQIACYYLLYRMNVLLKNKEEAKKYKEILLTKYPDSEYAQIIKNPDYVKEMELSKNKTSSDYAEAYNLYLSGKYNECITKLKQINFTNNENIKPKADYLQALCTGKLTNNGKDFILALQQVSVNYPKDPVADQAKELIRLIKGEKKPVDVVKDTVETYVFDAKKEHFVFLLIDKKSIKLADFKTQIAKFNTANFGSSNLSVEDAIFNETSYIITVKKFADKAMAELYYNQLKGNEEVKKINPSMLTLFMISDKNYGIFYTSKNTEEYKLFFQNNYTK